MLRPNARFALVVMGLGAALAGLALPAAGHSGDRDEDPPVSYPDF